MLQHALSYPYIVIDPEIAGGRPVVEGTRIPVAVVVRAHQLGMGFDEILTQYPTLGPAQLHAALLYFLDHQDEIELLLEESDTPVPTAKIITF